MIMIHRFSALISLPLTLLSPDANAEGTRSGARNNGTFITKDCGRQVEPFGSNYVTNNRSALPVVGKKCHRYYAELTDNTLDKTLHYQDRQGRFDGKIIAFPFEVISRNIGIGTLRDSQIAPAPSGSSYIFSGLQVHATDFKSINSSHVVVGHRGGTTFTVEGKNTVNGSSTVNDAGANVAPDGRADLRIVGNPDRTLTVYWQLPNPQPGAEPDNWILYNRHGKFLGRYPPFGPKVYVGLITYALGFSNVPFVGTADSLEVISSDSFAR